MLPSDVARLVLAYLHEEGLETTYRAFLMESPHLEELRRNPNATVLRPSAKTLVATLEEYEDIKEMEKKRYVPDKVLSGLWRKFESIIGQIKFKYQTANNGNTQTIQSSRSKQNLMILRQQQASDFHGHTGNIQPKIVGQLVVPNTSDTVTMVTDPRPGSWATARIVIPPVSQSASDTAVCKTSRDSRYSMANVQQEQHTSVTGVNKVIARQQRDSDSSVQFSSDAVDCFSQLTPIKQKPGNVTRQDSDLFKSPKRKSTAPKKKTVRGTDHQKKPDPPQVDEIDLEEELKDLPQLLETLLSSRDLQRKLAGNINKALPLEAHKPNFEVPSSPQDPSVGLSLSIDDILNTQVSEETVSEIVEMTSSDPAFESLFSLFNVDKDQYAQEQKAQLDKQRLEKDSSPLDSGHGEFAEPMDSTPTMAMYGKPPTSPDASQSMTTASLQNSNSSISPEISRISTVIDINENSQMEMEPVLLPSLDGSDPQIMSPVAVSSETLEGQTSSPSTVTEVQNPSFSFHSGHCMVPPKKRQSGFRMESHSSVSGLNDCRSPSCCLTFLSNLERKQSDSVNTKCAIAVTPSYEDQLVTKVLVKDNHMVTIGESKLPKTIYSQTLSPSSNATTVKRDLFSQERMSSLSPKAKNKLSPSKKHRTPSPKKSDPQKELPPRRTSGRQTRSPKRFSPCTPPQSKKNTVLLGKQTSPAKLEKGKMPGAHQGSSRSRSNTPQRVQDVKEQQESSTPKKNEMRISKLQSPQSSKKSRLASSIQSPIKPYCITGISSDRTKQIPFNELNPAHKTYNTISSLIPTVREHVEPITLPSLESKTRLKNSGAAINSTPNRIVNKQPVTGAEPSLYQMSVGLSSSSSLKSPNRSSAVSPLHDPQCIDNQDIISEPNTPQMRIISQPGTPQTESTMSAAPRLTSQVVQTVEVVSDETEKTIVLIDSSEAPVSTVSILQTSHVVVAGDTELISVCDDNTAGTDNSQTLEDVNVTNIDQTTVCEDSPAVSAILQPTEDTNQRLRCTKSDELSESNDSKQTIADELSESSEHKQTVAVDPSQSSDPKHTIANELSESSEPKQTIADELSESSEPKQTIADELSESSEPKQTITDELSESSESKQTVAVDPSQSSDPKHTIANELSESSQSKQTTADELLEPTEPKQTIADELSESSEPKQTIADELSESSEPKQTIADELSESSEPKQTVAVDPSQSSDPKHIIANELSESSELKQTIADDHLESSEAKQTITSVDGSHNMTMTYSVKDAEVINLTSKEGTEQVADNIECDVVERLKYTQVAQADTKPEESKHVFQIPSLNQAEQVFTVPCVISGGTQPTAILQAPVPLPHVQSPAKSQTPTSISAEVQNSIGPMQAFLMSSNLAVRKGGITSPSTAIQKPLQTTDSIAVSVSLGHSDINSTSTGRKGLQPILPSDMLHRCRSVTIITPSISGTPVSEVHDVSYVSPASSGVLTTNVEQKGITNGLQSTEITETPNIDTIDHGLSVGNQSQKSGGNSKSLQSRPSLRRYVQTSTPHSLIKRGMVVRSLDVGGNTSESTRPRIILPHGGKSGYVVRKLDCQDTSKDKAALLTDGTAPASSKVHTTPKGYATLKAYATLKKSTTPKVLSKPNGPTTSKNILSKVDKCLENSIQKSTPLTSSPDKTKHVLTPKKRTPRKQDLKASVCRDIEAEEVDLAAEVLASCSPKKTPIKQIIHALSDDSSEISRAAETLMCLSHSPPARFTALQKAHILQNVMNSPRRNLMSEGEKANLQAVNDKSTSRLGRGLGRQRGRPTLRHQANRTHSTAIKTEISNNAEITNGPVTNHEGDDCMRRTTSNQVTEESGVPKLNGDILSGCDDDITLDMLTRTNKIPNQAKNQIGCKKRSRDDMVSDQLETKKSKKVKRKRFPTNMDVDKFLSQLHYPQ